MTFDLSQCERDENGHWKAQTGDGRPVRILCADAKRRRPLVGLVQESDGSEIFHDWMPNGDSGIGDRYDLINPPRKQTVTVEIWTKGQSVVAGIPEDFDPDYRESRGYKLAKTLTTEIEVP